MRISRKQMNYDGTNYINIAFFGAIHSGKTRLINALLGNEYGGRFNTFVPTTYFEAAKSFPDETRELAVKRSKEAAEHDAEIFPNAAYILEVTKWHQFFVPPIRILGLEPDVVIAVHDIPGLDHSRYVAHQYHDLACNSFKYFNIIIFVIDVTVGFTDCNRDILQKILVNIKDSHTLFDSKIDLVVAINKCDDMQATDIKRDQIYPSDPETRQKADKIRSDVHAFIAELKSDVSPHFSCLSSNDSFVFRTLSCNPNLAKDADYRGKFFANYNPSTRTQSILRQDLISESDIVAGLKSSGFSHFEQQLAIIADYDMQYRFLLDHLKVNIWMAKVMDTRCSKTVLTNLSRFEIILNHYKDLRAKFANTTAPTDPYFANTFTSFISEYAAHNKRFFREINPEAKATDHYDTLVLMHQIYTKVAATFADWFSGAESTARSIADIINRYVRHQILQRDQTLDDIWWHNNLVSKFIGDDRTIHDATLMEIAPKLYMYQSDWRVIIYAIDYIARNTKVSDVQRIRWLFDNIEGICYPFDGVQSDADLYRLNRTLADHNSSLYTHPAIELRLDILRRVVQQHTTFDPKRSDPAADVLIRACFKLIHTINSTK